MLGNSAQRPSAEECLCYQWLQPGRTTLCNVVPMPVLFGLKVWTCELILTNGLILKMQVLHWCFGMFWISSMNISWFGGCSMFWWKASCKPCFFSASKVTPAFLLAVFLEKKHILAQSCKFQKTSGFSTLSAFLLLRLERLLHYDARIRGSKASCRIISCQMPHAMDDVIHQAPTTNAQEVAGNVMTQLSSGRISCASSVFAKATLPRQFEAGRHTVATWEFLARVCLFFLIRGNFKVYGYLRIYIYIYIYVCMYTYG